MEITISQFITELWNKFKKAHPCDSLLNYGHLAGWLEDQDEVYSGSFIDKRTAARILHSFMSKELSLPDLENIRDADILQDLYTCRVCVNHVAQMFLRGIMDKEEILINGQEATIFNMTRLLSREETLQIIEKAYSIYEKQSD